TSEISDLTTLTDPVAEAAIVSPPFTNDSPVPSLDDPETLSGSEVTVPPSVASSGDLPVHDQGLTAAETSVDQQASVDGQAMVDGPALDDSQVIDGSGGSGGASVNWPNDSAALDPPATEEPTSRDLAVTPSIAVRDDWADVFSSIAMVDPDAMFDAKGNSVPATTEVTAEASIESSIEASMEAKPSDGDEPNEVSPQRALPSDRIVFVNLTENRGPVRFLVGKRSLELLPGERFEVADGSPERPSGDGGPLWNVKFHRGGKYGESDSVLTAGESVFHVSPERGWELSPGTEFTTTPSIATPPELSVPAGDLSTGDLGADDLSVKEPN
ncbi:MAG: hypothetical protein O2931_14600, partial [Planctomycetota bacterium]|nr:hypothetical protein [Planctomycetota bacterium]